MITKVANIKAKLTITGNDFDKEIERMILGMGRYIEQMTDTKFGGGAIIEYFDAEPIMLSSTPVKDDSFGLQLFNTNTNQYDDVAATEYRRLSDGRVLYTFTPGPEAVKVEYETGDVPHDIRELCERLVMRQYRKWSSEGEKSVSMENSTTTWHALMQPEDMDIINSYRIWI